MENHVSYKPRQAAKNPRREHDTVELHMVPGFDLMPSKWRFPDDWVSLRLLWRQGSFMIAAYEQAQAIGRIQAQLK